MPDEVFFISLMVELRLDCSCVSSQSCPAEALQGHGTASQAKLLESCAKPAGSHVWTSRVQWPEQAFPVVSEPSHGSVSFASPLRSCSPWGGCSGDPAFRCSQFSSAASSVSE